MPLPTPARSSDERVLAGVCAGLAQTLGVDATLVRLVFAVLALAGGAGVVLYLALWAWGRSDRAGWALLLVVVAGSLALQAVGLSERAVVGIALVAGGLALAWRRGSGLRPDAPLSYGGVALAAAGAVLLLSGGNAPSTVLAPGAVIGALLLIGAPWLWQLAVDRDAERAARIRSDERADMAARIHDSVLQTLALIQRHAQEPRRVASLARRQERELRDWLYGDRVTAAEGASLLGVLSAVASEIEELYGMRVEVASSGDCAVDDSLEPLVLAAREAMANAAKFAGVEEIDVYVEVTDEAAVVFVHDRGGGFDRAGVPVSRRGLAESIEGRLERAGGRATIVTAPGAGTEVEMRLPRTP
jgi:signal transduction histidine kinase